LRTLRVTEQSVAEENHNHHAIKTHGYGHGCGDNYRCSPSPRGLQSARREWRPRQSAPARKSPSAPGGLRFEIVLQEPRRGRPSHAGAKLDHVILRDRKRRLRAGFHQSCIRLFGSSGGIRSPAVLAALPENERTPDRHRGDG
jgi:hypothetical protein